MKITIKYIHAQLIDRQQSWSWVVQHRLPLFKKSDLYSEYKLCKMLTMSEVTVAKSKSCIALSSKSRKSNTTSRQNQRLRTEEADTLPPLDISPSSSKMLLKSQGSVPALVSSPRLIKSHSVVSVSGGQTKQKIQRTVSHNPTKVKLSADDLKLIGSKSGMNALWRFLRGKAGEKNWLFWLDAERLKCCTKPDDEKRYTVVGTQTFKYCCHDYFSQGAERDQGKVPPPNWFTQIASRNQESV